MIGDNGLIKALIKTLVKITDLAVNTQNSADNVDIVDVIGNKTDTIAGTSLVSLLKQIKSIVGSLTDSVSVPFVAGVSTILGFLQTGYFHVHGASFIYPKYAVPVQLTSNAAAWNTTGNITEIIPANAIAKDFDLHWASLSEISADLFGVIDIYSGAPGAEVLIGSVDVNRTVNFSREGVAPVQIPQQPENTRISAKFTDSTASARTVRVKFYGHVYSTSL